MQFLPVTLFLVVQTHCEWVEITQQYKKPVRPTHNHPVLATTAKISKTERTTNRNRVYINNSLPEYNWNTDFVNHFGYSDENNVKFESSAVKFKDHDNVYRGLAISESSKNNDELILNNPKPEHRRHEIHKEIIKKNPFTDNFENARIDNKKLSGQETHNNEKQIEILNMSELEDIDVDYISQIDKRKQNIDGKVVSTTKRRKPENQLMISESADKRKQNFDPDADMKRTVSKITNMRRVEIIRSTSTVRTPTQQFEYEYQSEKPLDAKKTTKISESLKDRLPTSPYKFPNIGVVKRVNITTTRRPTQTPAKTSYETTIRNDEKFVEYIEHDFNARRGVSRPQFLSTTERTHTTAKVQKIRYESTHEHRTFSPNVGIAEEITNEDLEDLNLKVHKVASIGTVKKVQNTKETQNTRQNDNLQNKQDLKTIMELDTKIDRTAEIKEFKPKKNIATERPEEATQIEGYQPNLYRPLRPSQETLPEFVTKDETFIKDNTSKNQYEGTSKTIYKTKPPEPSNTETIDKHVNRKNSEDPLSNETKPNAIENLIKFLKTVTAIISKNSRRGVIGKMRYLEDLRDTILANIEERLEAAFPDDSSDADGQPRRKARSASEARGHVEFPSSESALMTISFLTFAVFLIKLVLQVIQAYKNKTMMVMPTVISAVSRAFSERQSGN